MIRFSLKCGREHAFEGWFRDGASFDTLVGEGLVTCPECGASDVAKALMAPAVVTSRRRAKAAAPAEVQVGPSPSGELQAVAVGDDRERALRAMLREMRDHVMQHTRDVGSAFAAEARRMHEGETEQAAIRGVASPDDVRSLIDDGIEVAPLPVFPDDRN